MVLTAEQRVRRARSAAYASWANAADRKRPDRAGDGVVSRSLQEPGGPAGRPRTRSPLDRGHECQVRLRAATRRAVCRSPAAINDQHERVTTQLVEKGG